jgi:Fur family ferric uptake transcriptional regulator
MKRLHEKEKQELSRLLAQSNPRRADDMVDILDAFLENEDHQSARDLHQRLKARGRPYDPETVQEALDLFCRYGLAQAKQFNGDQTRYEHKHVGMHHDHLICIRCGRVEEFVNPVIEDLQTAAARKKGFLPLDHRMDVYGLCAECTNARGQAIPLCDAEKGERVLVMDHEGGEVIQRRLEDMGLNRGEEVEVLSNGSGPVVVACRGARLALGRGMSEKVRVRPCPTGPPAPSCPKPKRRRRKSFWRP